MRRLSTTGQNKAIAFLKNQGRPLEQKLFAYYFEGGTREDVLAELAHFQNPDGGFGHGLEPDVRLPASSVIATTVAFQRFRDIHAPADHPVVVSGCRYLRDTYDAATGKWPIVPPTIDDAPHAPWMVYDGALAHSASNPRAEIVGYLHAYADQFPAAFRQQLTEAVVAYLLAQPETMEMHDLLCYLRLYETPALPEAIQRQLFDKLRRIVESIVTRDPDQWHSYGLQPLGVVSGPDSPFAALFPKALDANLDFVISQQGADGVWSPNWAWDRWPETWAQARIDWQGVLTLNTLCQLQAFGRLAR